jgi:iron complex outermembrane receptor protein
MSLYRFDRDEQRSPTTASATAAAAPSFGTAGRAAVLGGTGWSTLDVKGTWRVDGTRNSAHVVTFGAHDDRYKLYNPTFNTAEWRGGPYTTVASEGDGKTRTQALWAQAVWTASPAVKLTTGVRYEDWSAYDGLNINGATTVRQRGVSSSNVSPKGTLAWTISPQWSATLSLGKAYRYATAAELFQLVTTGTTFTSPNPDLKPDNAIATELKLERRLDNGRMRLSLFQDDIRDAIILAVQPTPPWLDATVLFSFQRRPRTRPRRRTGARSEQFHSARPEPYRQRHLAGRKDTRPLRSRQRHSGPGRRRRQEAAQHSSPGAPATSYRTASAEGGPSRQAVDTVTNSGRLWTIPTLIQILYQGFAAWFVADMRLHFRANRNWSGSLGVDNVLGRKYFVLSPFSFTDIRHRPEV